jgi:hypothetical protein
MNKEMERQRAEVLRRLQAKKEKQSDQDFEAQAVVAMLKQAESQTQAAKDRATERRGQQKSLVTRD